MRRIRCLRRPKNKKKKERKKKEKIKRKNGQNKKEQSKIREEIWKNKKMLIMKSSRERNRKKTRGEKLKKTDRQK